jgi:putative ABC transport system ATP-binding protein
MLKIENLYYRHKSSDDDVLKGLNAHFEAGVVNAILGPADRGKAALLSILAGLAAPTRGTVSFCSVNLAELDINRYRREHIALVLQAFHLFPFLTALENVCYPMEQSGIEKQAARRKAAELLESVGISDDRHKLYPSKLSGGRQQCVAIARALATGARVILADEPTGNLDISGGRAVMAILRHLAHHRGYCVIIFTQNFDSAKGSDVLHRISDGMMRKIT